MITYELTLKLKELGFPQNSGIGTTFYCGGKEYKDTLTIGDAHEFSEYHGNRQMIHTMDCECCCSADFAIEECVKSPTLSELIEACDSVFYNLEKEGGQALEMGCVKERGQWIAKSKMYGLLGEDYGIGYQEYGHSPEEAVANLWIALNKK